MESVTSLGRCPQSLQRNLREELLEQTREQVETLDRIKEVDENDTEPADPTIAPQSRGGEAGLTGGDHGSLGQGTGLSNKP